MKIAFKTLLLVIALLILWVVGPIVLIWSLNTLFSMQIEYSWPNWLAAFCLGMFARGSITFNKG
jgi:hypothetical protein